MKCIFLLILCLQVACQDKHNDKLVYGHSSKIDGKDFEWEVEEAHIDDAPVWEDKAPCPPVPPKKAISIAQTALKHYVNRGWIRRANPSVNWELEQLSLIPVWGGWIWIANFEETTAPGQGASGIASTACVIVLMDGKVLFPNRDVPANPLQGN